MLPSTLSENLKIQQNLFIGKAGCPFCINAFNLLAEKGIHFLYIPKEKNQSIVDEIKKNHDHKTFPAIFLNGEFVGGFDSLKAKI
ncbi:hypothetical protein GVAV_003387 [Gurleya vavrai]